MAWQENSLGEPVRMSRIRLKTWKQLPFKSDIYPADTYKNHSETCVEEGKQLSG